jgi:hypothetical protein
MMKILSMLCRRNLIADRSSRGDFKSRTGGGRKVPELLD